MSITHEGDVVEVEVVGVTGLDGTSDGAIESTTSISSSARRSRTLLAFALAVIALVVWAPWDAAPDAPDALVDEPIAQQDEDVAGADQGRRGSRAFNDEGDSIPGIGLWTGLPKDFEPRVSISPGSGARLLPQNTGQTLVYINSAGRATIVDIDSGRRSEVRIAPGRAVDHFGVEDGRVVALEGHRNGIPAATERALPFTVMTKEPGSTNETAPSDNPEGGPVLCPAEIACGQQWLSTSLTHASGDSAEILNTGDHLQVHQLLFGENPQEGRFQLIDIGADEPYRLPLPDSDVAWIITKTQ